jgi:hypothetical protein
MTTLEMTKLCAEAMGWSVKHNGVVHQGNIIIHPYICQRGDFNGTAYNPLHDDEQAMAMVKKFLLGVFHSREDWVAHLPGGMTGVNGSSADLNRAIVECVAKMQKAKNEKR